LLPRLLPRKVKWEVPTELEPLTAKGSCKSNFGFGDALYPHPGSTAIELSDCFATFRLLILLSILIVISCGLKIKSRIKIKIKIKNWVRLLISTPVRPGPLPLASAEPPAFAVRHRRPAQPGSDGRGRIVPRATAYPTALETTNDGAGCSLSRRTGEGQGQLVRTPPPTRHLFLHKS